MSTPRHGDAAPITIRLADPADAEAVMDIYNVEVLQHRSTMDLVPRTLDQQKEWLADRSGAFAAVVAEIDVDGVDTVVGFASLSPFKPRHAYSTTVENSVYVSRDHAGLGIGRALMDHLVDLARTSGFHSIIAHIEASSTSSRALHLSCGFEVVGVQREVGRKFGKWLDVAVYQLML